MQNKKEFNINLFFLFLLALNYIIPILLFGNITLFYHDALDSEVVYNHVIGKFLKGDKEAFNLFLNGQIQLEFLRRVFHPFIFLYVIFETELAYWITDILVKLTSYFSFLILDNNLSPLSSKMLQPSFQVPHPKLSAVLRKYVFSEPLLLK